MFLTIILVMALVNTFCAITMTKIPFVSFFFYVWKEIYVMLLFQQLWSVIHSTIHMSQAKFLYGLIFAFGGLGGIFGSILPGFFAVSMGSPNLIFASSRSLTMLSTFAFIYMLRRSSVIQEAANDSKTDRQLYAGRQRNSELKISFLHLVHCDFNASRDHADLLPIQFDAWNRQSLSKIYGLSILERSSGSSIS